MCRCQSCSSPITLRSRSDRRTSTHENKSWARNVLLQRSDNALAFELVLASRGMLLLFIESAKDISLLTQIQETNEVNLVRPIMSSAEVAALFIMIELATTKCLLDEEIYLLLKQISLLEIMVVLMLATCCSGS